MKYHASQNHTECSAGPDLHSLRRLAASFGSMSFAGSRLLSQALPQFRPQGLLEFEGQNCNLGTIYPIPKQYPKKPTPVCSVLHPTPSILSSTTAPFPSPQPAHPHPPSFPPRLPYQAQNLPPLPPRQNPRSGAQHLPGASVRTGRLVGTSTGAR